MSKDEKEFTEPLNITLPIEWHTPDNIQSRYATNVVVQAGQHEFVISFFEILPPMLLGQLGENNAQIEQLKSVKGECVGKIIVAAEQIPGIITALQQTWDTYQAAKKEV